MTVTRNDGQLLVPNDGGDPGVVDRNRCSRLFEFKPQEAVGPGDLAVDRRDFNARQIGTEPIGVQLGVP